MPRRYKHASEAFEAILGPFLRKQRVSVLSTPQQLHKDIIMFARKKKYCIHFMSTKMTHSPSVLFRVLFLRNYLRACGKFHIFAVDLRDSLLALKTGHFPCEELKFWDSIASLCHP